RIIAPDRTGYGHSTRVTQHPDAFHLAAANETTDFLDAIGVKRPVLWGHSDGAVIAAIMGLTSPDRFPGLILEAFHFYRNKAGSRDFFETMFEDPDRFGERVAAMLAREHGPQHWREVLEMEGRAWLKIIEESSQPEKDLFGGRLSELAVPTVFIHGERDPRTEPGELDALKRQLPRAGLEVIGGAGHSPHTESAAVDECNTIAERFLAKILA
ncbi:MAG TPA: alpha/beta fold hydrolase, partial [Blastocatellia bacterium]|nr:alpha/beta fold hydrolase [Blastocatellia bacterium]